MPDAGSKDETAPLRGTLLSVKQLLSAIYSVHEDDVLWGSGSELRILNYKQIASVPYQVTFILKGGR